MQKHDIPHAELGHFSRFREELFSKNSTFETPHGHSVPIIYTDSTAMGPPLLSIEDRIRELLQERSIDRLQKEYEHAVAFLRNALNAGEAFELIGIGTGCTGAMNLLTRDILGYRLPDRFDAERVKQRIPVGELPVFVTTLMEHHSSDLVLRECLHKQLIHIGFDDDGLPDTEMLERVLGEARRAGPNPLLLSWSAGSNVTGIQPHPSLVVEIAHRYGALVALDYAAAGPYVDLDLLQLDADAVGLSPHKFPGGPQASGLLCIRRELLARSGYRVPYPRLSSMIEMIRIAEVFRVKKAMGIEAIRKVVGFYARYALDRLEAMPAVMVIGQTDIARFAIISFLVRSRFDSAAPPPVSLKPFLLPFPQDDGMTVFYVHHNLIAKLLNDVYGIQVRPGCSCAGPYGHWLLGIDQELSEYHRDRIDRGLLDMKPGWIRATLNELNSLEEVNRVLDGIEELSSTWETHVDGYSQNTTTGEFLNANAVPEPVGVDDWEALEDPSAARSNDLLEDFIREKILPYAANTHTEVSFTGTVTTRWYHWAQQTVKTALGADEHYALRFIRAGYDPLRCVLFALGLEIPARLEARYGVSNTVPSKEWVRLITLGAPLENRRIPLLARVLPCWSVDELLVEVDRDPAKTIVLLGFHNTLCRADFSFATHELAEREVPTIADVTQLLRAGPIHLVEDRLAGAVVATEHLPGGLQTHPLLLLREDLFGNRLPMDVGGGIVNWTTEHLQRYVSDRTMLEDAGTPGIIQGIRTGLVMGLVQFGHSRAQQMPPPVVTS